MDLNLNALNTFFRFASSEAETVESGPPKAEYVWAPAPSTGETKLLPDLKKTLFEILGNEVDSPAAFDKLIEKLKVMPQKDLKAYLQRFESALSPERFKRLQDDLNLVRGGWTSDPRGIPGDGGSNSQNVDMSLYPAGEVISDKPLMKADSFYHYHPGGSEPGKKPENIYSGFSQGYEDNCVITSWIKAGMALFGQKDVFEAVKEVAQGYFVTMRDGFKLYLSKGELQLAARNSGYKGDDPVMLTDANFMFAVAAKRAQLVNSYDRVGQSYADGVKSLNDGASPWEGYELLGLKDHIKPGRDSNAKLKELETPGEIGVASAPGHNFLVVDGRQELFGTRGGKPDPTLVEQVYVLQLSKVEAPQSDTPERLK